jgi:uncharacterized membrane protein
MTPRKEIASSLTLILFSVVFLVYTTRYPIDDWESPGPAVFPLLLGTVLLILAVSLFARALWTLHRQPPPAGEKTPWINLLRRFLRDDAAERRVFVLVVILFFYVLLMPWIGFFVCTLLLVIATSRLMEAKDRVRPILLSLAIGLFCYLLFEVWIKLSFPRGFLF